MPQQVNPMGEPHAGAAKRANADIRTGEPFLYPFHIRQILRVETARASDRFAVHPEISKHLHCRSEPASGERKLDQQLGIPAGAILHLESARALESGSAKKSALLTCPANSGCKPREIEIVRDSGAKTRPASLIRDPYSPAHYVHLRMVLEKMRDLAKCSRLEVIVRIQVSADIACGAGKTLIEAVRRTAVGLEDYCRTTRSILFYYVPAAVLRAGINNYIFDMIVILLEHRTDRLLEEAALIH
jgi:hypothetical protein